MGKIFKINISQSIPDDLKKRIANTRWADEIENSKWEYGTNKAWLKELCDYWQDTFDWKKQEEYLNSFLQFKTTADGIGLHYVHRKGQGQHFTTEILRKQIFQHSAMDKNVQRAGTLLLRNSRNYWRKTSEICNQCAG